MATHRELGNKFYGMRQAAHLVQTNLFPVYGGGLAKAATTPETVTKEQLRAVLQRHFQVREEVTGEHRSGRRVRIDFMCYPLSAMQAKGWPAKWFGIEAKSYGLQDQRKKAATRLLYQAIVYRESAFIIDGERVFPDMVLIYPPFAQIVLDDGADEKEYRSGFVFALGKVGGMFRVLELSLLEDGREFEVYVHSINPWFTSRFGKERMDALGKEDTRASR